MTVASHGVGGGGASMCFEELINVRNAAILYWLVVLLVGGLNLTWKFR